MPQIRTFIAFELPEPIIAHIRSIQEGVRSYRFDIKWVRPENIHLTLKFLGDIEESDAEIVGQYMADTIKECKPVSLSAKGIGVFPNLKRPRVLWIGLKGDTHQLIELQNRLENQLEQAGFPKEDRQFKAHLTLARIKDRIDSSKLVSAMEKFADIESQTFTANEIILFKSDLKPSGAVYTPLINLRLNDLRVKS